MEILFYVFLGLAVIMAGVFIAFSNGQKSLKPLIFKAIASFLFTLVALFACFSNGFGAGLGTNLNIAALLFILGFVASCFGDVILALPDWERNQDIKQKLILSGGLAFTVAHVCYFIGMVLIYGFAWYVVLMALAFAAFFYLFNTQVLKSDFGPMKYGIMIYAFFVSFVACQGIYALIALGFGIYALFIALGFLLFYASDVVLMNIYFGKGDESRNRKAYYYNLAFYYLAQILLAASLFFLI